MRKVAQNSSFSKYLAGEAEPGQSVQSEAQWEEYVRDSVRTEYHPIGTASMMPRAEQGVVDPRLTVYGEVGAFSASVEVTCELTFPSLLGTSNVRVADLSILPLHVSTHVSLSRQKLSSSLDDPILTSAIFSLLAASNCRL